MRMSFLSALTAATVLAGGMAAGWTAMGDITPANAIREAAIVCGNAGCYRPQVLKIQHRKFQPLGQPAALPLGHG